MSSSAKFLVAVAIVGCTADDPLVVEVTARATVELELGPSQADPVPAKYRWALIMSPAKSKASIPQGHDVARFVPDIRGLYVVDRWLEYGLADRLTHEFVVRADGVAPTAVISAESSATVGSTVMLDASQSDSVENRALTYVWRLAQRPHDSTAALVDPKNAITTFVADIAGDFSVELAVFDGELWSEPHATMTITAR